MTKYILMFHESRKEYLPYLQDLFPDAPVSMDNGELGLVKAHIQAWELALQQDADYVFVIQDDVVVTSDFHEKVAHHVEQCKKKYGRIAMHLYLRNTLNNYVLKTVAKAKNKGIDHCVLGNVHSGNSIGLPKEHIKPMLDHFHKMDVASGDKRINSYLRENNIPVYFPLPNLVDHRKLESLHCGNVSRHDYRVSIWYED